MDKSHRIVNARGMRNVGLRLSGALFLPVGLFVVMYGDARPGSLCSIAPFQMGLHSQTTMFIGRATAETLFAGSGAVRHGFEGGHWSNNRQDRRVFGQRIVVQRLAGAHASALGGLFADRADSSVVVVPWDYDPGCEPVVWGGSFAWTAPDSTGVFTVTLRSRELWVDSMPTFDARMAAIQPYPHGIYYQRGFRGARAIREGRGMSVREYFEFQLALTDSMRTGAGTEQLRTAVCGWAAEHRDRAARWPASQFVSVYRCLDAR